MRHSTPDLKRGTRHSGLCNLVRATAVLGATLMLALVGCRLGESDPTSFWVVREIVVEPVDRQALDLSDAHDGDVLLRFDVWLDVRDTNKLSPYPDAPVCRDASDSEITAAIIVYPGTTGRDAERPAAPDEAVPLRGLVLEAASGPGTVCEANSGPGRGYRVAYRLRVADASQLPAQPLGDLDLRVVPRLCIYDTPSSDSYTGVPDADSPTCDGHAARLPVRVTAVPEAASDALLSLSLSGNGRVVSTPPGIDCPGDCEQRWPAGTRVRFTVTPGAGSGLAGLAPAACAADPVELPAAGLACEVAFTTGSGGWFPVGTAQAVTPAPSAAYVGDPVIDSDASGRLVLAWVEDEALQVRRWTGTTWQALSDGLPADRVYERPSLAIAPDGEPVIAWQRGTPPSADIFVARWNGSTWATLGGAVDQNPAQPAMQPSVRLLGNDPVVAFIETRPAPSYSALPVVRRFVAGAWVDVAGFIIPRDGTIDLNPALAVRPDGGGLALAWFREGEGVHVAKESGPFWIDSAVFPATLPMRISLLNAGLEGLLLAYTPDGGATSFSVQRLLDGVWGPMGAPQGAEPPGRAVHIQEIALGGREGGGRPVLAWWQQPANGPVEVQVRVWSGGIWLPYPALPLVGRSGTPGVPGPPAVTLNARLQAAVALPIRTGVLATVDASVVVQEQR